MRIKKHTLHFYTLKCYDGNANKGGVKYEIIYLLLVNSRNSMTVLLFDLDL